MSPSPEDKLARQNRQRLAAEEGARAMEDAVKEAVAVRKNMARLRELRLAKEAAAVHEQISASNDSKPKPRKRSK
jgi:hypothetical protein